MSAEASSISSVLHWRRPPPFSLLPSPLSLPPSPFPLPPSPFSLLPSSFFFLLPSPPPCPLCLRGEHSRFA
ncbi:MAG: hypothetical protein GC168_19610 [Candidatus Hydrogenedens sp.]|nr:hypothetical protein [Candidatus Hydrogenedens sp.]